MPNIPPNAPQSIPPQSIPYAALILAAGYAKRMQSDKLLLPWHGKTLIRHVIDHAKALDLVDIYTVVRHDTHPALTDLLQDTQCIKIQELHKGMGASLICGMQAIMKRTPPHVQAAIVFLGDMPAMRQETLFALCHKAMSQADSPHAPSYHDKPGSPVIIPRAMWPIFTTANSDMDARALLHELGLHYMPTEDPYVCMDINTPSAYQELLHQQPPV